MALYEETLVKTLVFKAIQLIQLVCSKGQWALGTYDLAHNDLTDRYGPCLETVEEETEDGLVPEIP